MFANCSICCNPGLFNDHGFLVIWLILIATLHDEVTSQSESHDPVLFFAPRTQRKSDGYTHYLHSTESHDSILKLIQPSPYALTNFKLQVMADASRGVKSKFQQVYFPAFHRCGSIVCFVQDSIGESKVHRAGTPRPV
jgi:hypothetical protein